MYPKEHISEKGRSPGYETQWEGIQALAPLGKALLVVTNKSAGLAIVDVMAQNGFDVDLATTGIGALKKIRAGERYSILITQLLVDQISGTALMIELKKRHPVLAMGINNCSDVCRSIAKLSGFDVIVDCRTDPSQICENLLKPLSKATLSVIN